MDFVDGNVLDPWISYSNDSKEELVVKLAEYCADIFSQSFDTIGGLRYNPPASPLTTAIILWSVLATMFIAPHLLLVALIMWAFFSKRLSTSRSRYRPDCMSRQDYQFTDYLTPRGPFRNSHEWLRARLEACLTRYASDPAIVDFAHRMIRGLPVLFPADISEMTVLYHHDIHVGNVLIGTDGKPVAIIDWESVSVLPAWMACQPPVVCSRGREMAKPEEDLDSSWYDNDMYQYEMYHIYRPIFDQTMERIQPRWMEIFRRCELEREFEERLGFLEAGSSPDESTLSYWDDFEEDVRIRGPMFHLWTK